MSADTNVHTNKLARVSRNLKNDKKEKEKILAEIQLN